ncbi:hypothetical protein CBR_g48373 [Chara braunii]|uniref:Uncharacterized protein n=1 Tax=Chara braunii TaxID=69332 RepID=A0A388K4E1_CHABU|nr:hypothetical protein CBR_g48373 [Chara braunii]|eukprot:GBG64907.1 hypothetical protein CBR_g48373 [Chara braunii]
MAAKTLAPSFFRGLQDELKTSDEVHKGGDREMRHTVGVGSHNCPAPNSYKATTQVWSVLIRGIIGLPIGALVIGVTAILFGAPVSIDSLWKTATWSIFMLTLIAFGSGGDFAVYSCSWCCNRGMDWSMANALRLGPTLAGMANLLHIRLSCGLSGWTAAFVRFPEQFWHLKRL